MLKNLPHKESPSQTCGPYVHIGLTPNLVDINGVIDQDLGTSMATDATKGERITLKGQVFAGDGAIMPDALIEVWQANADGRYDGDGFQGWGRHPCNLETGVFEFETIKPGSVDGQAPHIAFWLVARGMGMGVSTRMYFPEEQANADDPVLSLLMDDPARLNTLIARKDGSTYHFNIVVQGENETVFFDI